jgi:hypothetical protein
MERSMPLKCAVNGYNEDRIKVACPGEGNVLILVRSDAEGLPHASLTRQQKYAALTAAKAAAEAFLEAVGDDLHELRP